MTFVHREALDRIKLFAGSPDSCFVAEIMMRLRPMMAPTGYIIYKKNEVAEEMYFLTKGKVHLLVEDHDDGSQDNDVTLQTMLGRQRAPSGAGAGKAPAALGFGSRWQHQSHVPSPLKPIVHRASAASA